MSDDTAPSELTGDDIEAMVRRIEKAPDFHSMRDILVEHVGWDERHRLLWHLTRTRALATECFPHLWSELVVGYEDHASPDDVVALLGRIEAYDSHRPDIEEPHGRGTGVTYRPERLIEDWPIALDRLACAAYHEAPRLFCERWETFDATIQKGVKLVQRRFDDRERDDCPEGMVRELAKIHVREDGLPARLPIVEEGELNQKRTRTPDGYASWLLDDFIELYGPRDAWEEALLEVTLEVDGDLPLAESRDGWRRADNDELVDLMSKVHTSGHLFDVSNLYDVLLSRRDDDPDELFRAARRLREREQWAVAEVALASGVLQLESTGEPVPEWTDDCWTFASLEMSADRDSFCGLEKLAEALEYVPEERIVPRMLELFDEPREVSQRRPFGLLQVWPHRDDLIDAACRAVEHEARGPRVTIRDMIPIAERLALVGAEWLPRLVEEHEAADEPLLRDTYQRAIVYVLADQVRAGETIPPAYDPYITFVDWHAIIPDAYVFERDVESEIATVMASLPRARAESLLLDQLDPEREGWPRALTGVSLHPTLALIDRAFECVEREGMSPDHPHFDAFEAMLDELGAGAYPRLAHVLSDSNDSALHNAVRDVLGESTYDSLVEGTGGRAAADASRIDKIERISREWLESHPRARTTSLHLFRRLDEPPTSETISRVGGPPLGVDRETWPHKGGDDDLPMEHVFTLDRQEAPILGRGLSNEVRAVALFAHAPGPHRTWDPHGEGTEVRLLTDEDVEQRRLQGEPPVGEAEPGWALETRWVEIPSMVFESVTFDQYNVESEPLEVLREDIRRVEARSGGSPLWIQQRYPDMRESFLMQCTSSFCPMFPGEAECLYVFKETAFWQCH